MKKLIQIGLSSVLVFPVMALGVYAADWADNTTAMVTYFPVPYAAYNNIYVSDKFDVGTSTNGFELNLGEEGVSQSALEAEQVILHKTDSSTAQFTMDSDVYTPKAYFGNVAADGNDAVTLEFQNLRIGSDQLTIGTLEVKNLEIGELKLFGANLGGAECEGTVKTQRIDLGSIEGEGSGEKTYVVCCPADSASSCGM